MAKDTFYFSHDYNSRNDGKIKKLLSKHGYLGYGLFWAIVEDLYNNANALQLDCDSISFDLRTTPEVIKSIIYDFDLFVIEGDQFGSLSIQKRIDERNSKSVKARESAEKRWNKEKENANALPPQSEPNAIKESIVKENKENESIVILPETSSGEPINDFLILEEEASTQLPVNAKKKKKKKEVPEPERLLRAECKNYFLLFYLSEFQEEYDWPVKDSVAMPGFLRKIRNKIREKNPETDVTDDKTLAGFKQIISGIKDEFVIKNFSLALINSRFNEIFIQLKNPNYNGNKQTDRHGSSKYRTNPASTAM